MMAGAGPGSSVSNRAVSHTRMKRRTSLGRLLETAQTKVIVQDGVLIRDEPEEPLLLQRLVGVDVGGETRDEAVADGDAAGRTSAKGMEETLGKEEQGLFCDGADAAFEDVHRFFA